MDLAGRPHNCLRRQYFQDNERRAAPPVQPQGILEDNSTLQQGDVPANTAPGVLHRGGAAVSTWCSAMCRVVVGAAVRVGTWFHNERPANPRRTDVEFEPVNPGPKEDDVDLEALVNEMSVSSPAATSAADGPTSQQQHRGEARTAATQAKRGPPAGSAPGSGASSPVHVSPRQGLRRSLPMHIKAFRLLQQEDRQSSSLPAIPNPFPELGSPGGSPLRDGAFLPEEQSNKNALGNSESHGASNTEKMVIKVFSEDGTSRALEVPTDATARDVAQMLVQRRHFVDDNNWSLIESLVSVSIERLLEDHEEVMQVQASWGSDADSRLYFRKNYAKYEFFKTPLQFFPDQMVSNCSESASSASSSNGSVPHSQLVQNFFNSSSCPEIQGYLSVRESGKRSWKKSFFLLRRSGLYFSLKGTSKEPRHLQCFAEITESNVYTVLSPRKTHNAPSDFCFCLKPNKAGGVKDLKLLCAEDEQSKACWMTSMRLFKHGIQLYQNYRTPHHPRWNHLTQFTATPMRSISENSLVAMDFSGRKGRIIENPVEAQTVAAEEALLWKRRGCNRLNVLGSGSPGQTTTLSTMIHWTQPWFYGHISREEAQKIIAQQGLVDGVFLVRDCHSHAKAFVLSLCHNQKVRHFQILPVEDDGQGFYSLDEGQTKFSDLCSLVEFYQLNRGVLPFRLRHCCTRVAL
ncbi:growth factor receptor-bound protein 14-like isoform X1 [Petromyzon marinus]|uniref:Growth factor receptor-bound protein 14-like isoform X1 n=1 Tax=Petromyzon marinus TaxID=7757 RepID=A0AAJ7X553_PETMA|nr:growth factor receptor-bound protein 14-like isoform X1 [Petromyzon marinus]XP_032821629.1 growth factor receptor-bound protein 14-like isoform X1 [Petromyzon marinus]XP_032821630.1 growth factor receptor-bound protein 14-like isoform X1 [Petromyzon marinus]